MCKNYYKQKVAMQFFLPVFILLFTNSLCAQSVAINNTGAIADNTAILDITSTAKGILIPRVSTIQRNAIINPAKGLVVYDSTVNQFSFYDGTTWLFLNTGSSLWTASGAHQYSSVSGNVGIGIVVPADKLHVVGKVRIDAGKIHFVNTGNSVFIGENAGSIDDLSDNRNVFIGTDAGKSATTALGSVAVGYQSLSSNVTSIGNTALGYFAGNKTTGSGNTAIGYLAMQNNITGQNHVAIGNRALVASASGTSNVAIGFFSGANTQTGSYNTFIGGGTGLSNTAGSYAVAIGQDAMSNANSTSTNFNNTNIAIGKSAYQGSTSPSTNTGLNNTVIGYETLMNNTSGDNNITLGYRTLFNNTVGSSNIAIGDLALHTNTTAMDNIAIGTNAGYSNSTGNANIFIGTDAGKLATIASANTAIGFSAMLNNTTGINNVAIGYNSLKSSTGGNGNTAIGVDALSNNLDSFNTAIGYRALYSIGLWNNRNNTAVGKLAGSSSLGNNNVFIGAGTGEGVTGNGNVFIGRGVGAFENVSNKLFIDNTSILPPLIYGDFTDNIVGIMGDLGVGTITPTQAKLVVNGSASNTLNSYGYLSRTTVGNTAASTTANYSIYATDRIASSEFNAFSDERIKNIKGLTNSNEDLETLKKIEVTNYTLKDIIGKGKNSYKKVIAQQIEKIYPQAVSKITDVIPDIYKPAEMKEDKIFLIHPSLVPGDKIKLIYNDRQEIVTVTSTGNGGFTVNAKYNGRVFVYGTQVTDFRSVDYEAISMLNVSATQELAKQLKQQQETIKLQQQQIRELQKMLQPITKQ